MKIIRKNNVLLAIVIVLMLSLFSMIPQMALAISECSDPGAQSGGGVVPLLKPDNPTFGGIQIDCDNDYKINDPSSGPYNDDNGPLSGTITVTGNLVNWTSDIPVKAVIVKGGNCANLFLYPGGSMGDTLLHAPVNPSGGYYAISHIDFCYSDPECPPPGCEIGGDTEICDGSKTTLCVKDITGATYLWTGPGFTSGARCITVGVAGTYKVTIENECGKSTCDVKVTVYPKPDCSITAPDAVCDETTGNIASTTVGYSSYIWLIANGTITSGQGTNKITFSVTPGVTSVTIGVKVIDSNGCENYCSVKITVNPCEKRLCKCSLVVEKRDEAGNPIDDAVFKVDGIEKTTSGGEARWDNLECDTTYEVRELKPEERTERIHLGDCGERSTLRVVNKIEEGELEVLGIMEVLPFTGLGIPYSPFIGISTLLTGAVLYILSKPKKKSLYDRIVNCGFKIDLGDK